MGLLECAWFWLTTFFPLQYCLSAVSPVPCSILSAFYMVKVPVLLFLASSWNDKYFPLWKSFNFFRMNHLQDKQTSCWCLISSQGLNAMIYYTRTPFSYKIWGWEDAMGVSTQEAPCSDWKHQGRLSEEMRPLPPSWLHLSSEELSK